MESLVHLVANSSMVAIPGEDWKIHFVSEQIDDQLHMGQSNTRDLNLAVKSGSLKASQDSKEDFKVVQNSQIVNPEITIEEEAGLREESELLAEGGAEQLNIENAKQANGISEESMLKIDEHPLSQMSRLSEQVILKFFS